MCSSRTCHAYIQAYKYSLTLLDSSFCLVLRGDTPTSRRFFDAVAAGCVPVVVSDGLLPHPEFLTHCEALKHSEWCRQHQGQLPFASFLNYSGFVVEVPEAEFVAEDGEGALRLIQQLRELKDDQRHFRALYRELIGARESLIYGWGSPLRGHDAAPAASTLVNLFLSEVDLVLEAAAINDNPINP